MTTVCKAFAALLVCALCVPVGLGRGQEKPQRKQAMAKPIPTLVQSAVATAAEEPDKKKIPITLGRMGSKARGAMPDLPRRLREAISRELRDSPEVLVLDEAHSVGSRFSIESSVTEMSRRTTPSGELEVTCEVSMVIGLMPSRSIVGMTSGGATIQAPHRGVRLNKATAAALEADALSYAVRGANQNLLAFLRNQKDGK